MKTKNTKNITFEHYYLNDANYENNGILIKPLTYLANLNADNLVLEAITFSINYKDSRGRHDANKLF